MCRLFGFGRISRRGRSRAGGGVFGWYPARPPTEPSLVMRSSSAAFCASLTVGSGPSHRRLGQASRAWALPNRATNLRRSSKRLASSFSQWASSSGSTLGLRRLLCRRRLRRVVGPRRRVHLAETRRARRGCTHCRAPASIPAVCVVKSDRNATTSAHGQRAVNPTTRVVTPTQKNMEEQQPIHIPGGTTSVADSCARLRPGGRCRRVRLRCPNPRPRGERCPGCVEKFVVFTA